MFAHPVSYDIQSVMHIKNVLWPAVAVIWLLSLALPFYGTVNSLFNVLTTGFTAFILPCAAFNWHYRTKERRDNCPVRIPW